MADPFLDAQRVVVRAPNALGDLVMATSAFERLARHFGRQRLTLVCLPAGKPLLNGNNWFDEILPLDRKGRHRGFFGGWRFIGELRKRRFDLGILLPNSFGSAWQFFAGGVKRRVGYFKEGRDWLLHAGRRREHDAQGRFVPKYTGAYFMDLLDVIGLPPAPLRPTLTVTDAERAAAQAFLAGAGLSARLVILAPGAAYGPSKLWPAARFAAVGDALREAGSSVLVSYGPGEEDTLASVQQAARAPFATTAGLNLSALKAVYERAALVISNDTGPRHIAVALGRPVLCLMGPNDPRYSALPEVERGEVIRVNVDCAPYSQPCQLKRCPIDHRCMLGIDVERVLAAAKRELAQ